MNMINNLELLCQYYKIVGIGSENINYELFVNVVLGRYEYIRIFLFVCVYALMKWYRRTGHKSRSRRNSAVFP